MFEATHETAGRPAAKTLPPSQPTQDDSLPIKTRAHAHRACLKSRRMKVGYYPVYSPGADVPCLRLRGRWLKAAGFAIGRNVKVEVSEGRLMIEAVD
jgi:hypothetical protein